MEDKIDYNVLNYALESGIVDMSSIQEQIDMKRRQEYLEQHAYKTWKGSDGKWYTYVPNDDGGRKLLRRTSEKSLNDAIVDFYKKEEIEPTLGKVFKLWIQEKYSIKEIKKGTYDRYINAYNKDIKNTSLHKTKMKNISEGVLDDFIRERLSNSEMSPKAFANMRTLIIGIFKYGKRKGYTSISITSFFRDLDISRKAFKKVVKIKELQVFNENEIKQLLNWLRENPSVENYGIVLAFQTGLREGELSALKFSDVNGSVLHVQRQEIRYKEENSNKTIHQIVDYTKTESGDRYIYLPPQALDTIECIRKLNPNNELMMVKNNNQKIHEQYFNHYLYKACKACNIPQRSMHKIRKTYGTTLIDSGAEDSLIMNQMGHSDITTTRKYYYFSNKSSAYNQEQINKAISF